MSNLRLISSVGGLRRVPWCSTYSDRMHTNLERPGIRLPIVELDSLRDEVLPAKELVLLLLSSPLHLVFRLVFLPLSFPPFIIHLGLLLFLVSFPPLSHPLPKSLP